MLHEIRIVARLEVSRCFMVFLDSENCKTSSHEQFNAEPGWRAGKICPYLPSQTCTTFKIDVSTHIYIYYLSRSQKMLPAKGKRYPTLSNNAAVRCCQMLFAVYMTLCSYLCLLGGRIRQGLLCLNKFKQVHWHQLKIPIHSIHQIPFFTYLQPTPLFGSVGG